MRIWGLAGCLVLAGCWGHQVVASPPPRSVAHRARAAVYSDWRSDVLHTTTYVQAGAVTGRTTDRLTLANGLSIQHPEDLIPLTGDPSPYADRARAAGALYTRLQAFMGTGVGLALAGGGVLLVNKLQDQALFGDRQELGLGVTLGAIGVGFVVALVGGIAYAERSRMSRREAFESYDDALRANLGLCDDGSDCPERTPQSTHWQPRRRSCPSMDSLDLATTTPPPVPEREACVESSNGGMECVASVIRSAQSLIRQCYTRCLPIDPNLTGTVEVHFMLNTRAQPVRMGWQGMEGAPEVGECIGASLHRLTFPTPPSTVGPYTFSFDFNPG